MDEVMNSEEIVETTDNATEVDENYYVDDNSSASALPAVGIGLALGAAAAIAIPKAAKGIKKLAGKAKGKLADKAAEMKSKKAKKEEGEYINVEVEDED